MIVVNSLELVVNNVQSSSNRVIRDAYRGSVGVFALCIDINHKLMYKKRW